MKTIRKITRTLLLLLLGLSFQHAFSQEMPVKKVENLDANDKIAYYNLEKRLTVDEADTTKTGWDISFQHTKVILQASASGKILSDTSFDKIIKAPANGYLQGPTAIPAGSGNGWYTYNMENHTISPIPGKVILIHTASGKYIKLVIDSYYKDGSDGEAGNYTFRYAFIEPEK